GGWTSACCHRARVCRRPGAAFGQVRCVGMTATGHDLDRLGPVSAVDHLEPGDLLLGLGERPVEDHHCYRLGVRTGWPSGGACVRRPARAARSLTGRVPAPARTAWPTARAAPS